MDRGVGFAFGKCDHFTLGEEGHEEKFYVTTEFYGCTPSYPKRSYIATDEKIILVLPRISQRSLEWAQRRSGLIRLFIFALFCAATGIAVIYTFYKWSYWWSYILILISVGLLLIPTVYVVRYKHQASEESKAKYVQLMGEAVVLRDILRQLRSGNIQPSGRPDPTNPPPYSETSPLNYGYDQGPIPSYGGLGVPGNIQDPPAYHPGTDQPRLDRPPAENPHHSTQSYGGLGVPGNIQDPPAYHPGTDQPRSDRPPAENSHLPSQSNGEQGATGPADDNSDITQPQPRSPGATKPISTYGW